MKHTADLGVLLAVIYARVSLQGTLPGGEVWSINPAFLADFVATPPTQAQLDSWSSNVADDLESLVTGTLAEVMSNNAAITNVRVAGYDEAGHVAALSDAPVTPAVSGNSAQVLPGTAAVVCSLYTGTPGRSGRGRLFVPALGLSLAADSGRIAPARAAGLVESMRTLLSGIEDAAPAAFQARLGVWSKTKDQGYNVTTLKVGDVPDSQRRRKDTLDEAFFVVPYPLP